MNFKEFWLREESEKSIVNGVFENEVKNALKDFVAKMPSGSWAIFGGIALSAFVKPRYTEDIDVLLLTDIDEKVLEPIFRKHRTGAFEHKDSGVEIETVTPEAINQNRELAIEAIKNAKIEIINNKVVRIVTPKYLVALKLKRALGTGRASTQDRADIQALLEKYKIDITDLKLPEEQVNLFRRLQEEL